MRQRAAGSYSWTDRVVALHEAKTVKPFDLSLKDGDKNIQNLQNIFFSTKKLTIACNLLFSFGCGQLGGMPEFRIVGFSARRRGRDENEIREERKQVTNIKMTYCCQWSSSTGGEQTNSNLLLMMPTRHFSMQKTTEQCMRIITILKSAGDQSLKCR